MCAIRKSCLLQIVALSAILLLPGCNMKPLASQSPASKSLWSTSHSHGVTDGAVTYLWSKEFPEIAVAEIFCDRPVIDESSARKDLAHLLTTCHTQFLDAYRNNALKAPVYESLSDNAATVAIQPTQVVFLVSSPFENNSRNDGSVLHMFVVRASDLFASDSPDSQLVSSAAYMGVISSNTLADTRPLESLMHAVSKKLLATPR